jgi:hypothetical protein
MPTFNLTKSYVCGKLNLLSECWSYLNSGEKKPAPPQAKEGFLATNPKLHIYQFLLALAGVT